LEENRPAGSNQWFQEKEGNRTLGPAEVNLPKEHFMKTWIKVGACLAALATTEGMAAQTNAARLAPPLGLKNTEMSVKLLSPISTKTSRAGDRFSAQVLGPSAYEGAFMEGRIGSIKAAKHSGKAEISFQFETLTFQNATHSIQADLKEVANSQGVKDVDEEGRAIGKSSNKKALESALIGSALGGILGAAMGGAKGAAVGAGAGAGAGLLFAIKFTTSGLQMEFAPGSTFTLNVSDRAQR
jgi:hypothetical protein